MSGQRVGLRSPETAQSDLLSTLYAASTDPARWPAFIERVSHWFEGGTAMFLRPRDDPSKTRFLGGDIDPAVQKSHDEYYVRCNPWIPRVGKTHPILDVSEALVPTDEFVRTEFYNDWMRPQDFMHWVGMRPSLGDDSDLGLGVARSARRGPFDGDELRLLITLSEHLGRAGEISRRLELFATQSRAASSVLADLNAGVLLVDVDMRVVFANPVAEELLVAGDGIVARAGRLRAAATGAEAPLRDAVLRAAGRSAVPGTTLNLRRSSGAPPLTLTIGPLDERDLPTFAWASLAVIVVGVPERDLALDPERLRVAYDLTAAEARLAAALCAGRSLADHADDVGVSLNTVKFHLKAVFDKTGEARQPELVRRLVANPALRRPA